MNLEPGKRREGPPPMYRSPMHGPERKAAQPRGLEAPERDWLRYQIQGYGRKYWEPVAETDDRGRALAEAVKRARIGKIAYRVWDRVDRKEIWRGFGYGASVEEWKTARPPGMSGENPMKDYKGLGKRGRWSYVVLATKGWFGPFLTKQSAMGLLARVRRKIATGDSSPLYQGQGELVIGQVRRSPQGWEFMLPGTQHVTYHYDKARDMILRALARRPRSNDRRSAMTVPLDLRYKLIACRVTLDGRPAKISGAKEPFALVRSLDGKMQGEWSWDAALRVCRAGGRFKANPRTHRNPVISKRMQALRPGTMRLGDAMKYGKALLDAGYVIRVWDGSGWEVVIHPNDTLATSSGKGQSGGRQYLSRGAGMVKTWPITLIAYRGQQSLGWMTPDKIRPLLRQKTALANSGDAPTFMVMHVSVDGAGIHTKGITLKRKAIALAQKLQAKSDRRGNPFGYHYIVYRQYESGRSDAIYRTKSRPKASANWNSRKRALMNSPKVVQNYRLAHRAIVTAFLTGKRKSFGTSTQQAGTRYATDGQKLLVWGNLVAEKVPNGIRIRDAGWRTLLTKNVLNEILDQLGRSRISQTKHEWYIGRTPWEGEYVIPTAGTLANKRRGARKNVFTSSRIAVFCTPACKSSFRADRSAGAIYPAIHQVDAQGKRTGKWWTHEEFSGLSGRCAYCGKQTAKPKGNPWYYGYKKKGGGVEKFWSRHKPTAGSHGRRYSAVTGPFKTAGAMDKMYGFWWQAGPHTIRRRGKVSKANSNGRFRVGDLVVVSHGSGLRSGATARVVKAFDWKKEQGAYKPVPTGYVYLSYQWGGHGGKVGELFTMPANRLRLLGADKNRRARRNAFAKTPYYQIKGKIHHWESGQPAKLPKGKTLVTVYIPGVDATVFETWIAGGERHWKALRMARHHSNPLTRRESGQELKFAREAYRVGAAEQRAGRSPAAHFGYAQGIAGVVGRRGGHRAAKVAERVMRHVRYNRRARKSRRNCHTLLGKAGARSAMRFA